MGGICVVGGAADAVARTERMVGRMALYGQKTAVLSLSPTMAVGWSAHGRLPSDHAPVTKHDGITVALDGEIFEEDGPVSNPAGVVEDLYRNGELDRLAYLNGSFAAVIVDAPKNRIVLAGDRLGTRSLFLWHRGEHFAAASRLHALLSDNRVPRRLSFQGLVELLSYQRTVADHTQYADVFGLSGSTVVVIEEGRLSRRQTRRVAWRRPDFDEREGAVRLADAMCRAVKRRTGDRVRHSLLLSGGLDSRMVLAAARAVGHPLACATVGTHENREVSTARAIAGAAGVPFDLYRSLPAELGKVIAPSTLASDGLFSAPINLFGQLPELTNRYDVALSGHGLDYTLRGYYLPCRTIRLAGSVTRLPRLRPVPDGSPATVVSNLRVAEDASGLLKPEVLSEWKPRQVSAMATAIGTADIDSPYDAWDAFLLTTQGRHHAYSDFVAMDSVINHRAVAFDPDVFDLYLSMPPEWRASGRMAHAAMMRLGPDLMELPDANCGFTARNSFWTQITLIFGRAALRKIGLFREPALPDPIMTQGSWVSMPELFRRDPAFLDRLRNLQHNAALLDTGLFMEKELAQMVDDHVNRRKEHSKILLHLLAMASWLEQHNYTEVCRDV